MTDRVRELVECASRGDDLAVDALLQHHLPGLNGFVRLRMGPTLRGKESISDLVQSTCREVLQNLERFQYDGERGFKRWLYKTAQRKIANRVEYYRAQKREAGREVAPAPLEGRSEEDWLLEGYASFCSPSCEVAAQEEVARIEAAFEALPEVYREVILLSRLLGLTRKEIAEEMGRTEGSVRMLLMRALAALAEILGPTQSS